MPDEQSQTKSIVPNKQGVSSRDMYYQEAAKHTLRAIEVVVKLLDHKNENVQLGAAKTILAKSIPDLSGVELYGKDGQPLNLFVNLGSGFIPASIRIPAPPAAGTPTGQPPLQSSSLAPQGA